MFKYLPLLWGGMMRKPVRISLTFASLAIAFLLFGVLEAVRTSLLGGAELAGKDRIVTWHKVSRMKNLPVNYVARIAALDGVVAVSPHIWLGGIFMEDRNQVLAYIVDAKTFGDVYTEYRVPEPQRVRWIAERDSAIVGSAIAERFGWKIGDRIPMRSNLRTRADGSTVWPLTIAGIYHAENTENVNVYLHYDYFNESQTSERDSVGWIVTRVADATRSLEIAAQIDKEFANSGAESETVTESADAQSLAAQLKSVGRLITAIVVAVFGSMLLVAANTMANSVRERSNEIGVLKTLGFSQSKVLGMIFLESLLLVALAALCGLALANVAVQVLSGAVVQYFPFLQVPAATYSASVVLVVLFAALAALLPCVYAARLQIVAAFRVT